MGLVLVTAVALVAGLLVALPAAATSCTQWNRLQPNQKSAEIGRMIDSALQSNAGRSWDVNRNAVGRCLDRKARSMEYDFDDVCSQSSTASMRAIDDIFKNYIWTCVN